MYKTKLQIARKEQNTIRCIYKFQKVTTLEKDNFAKLLNTFTFFLNSRLLTQNKAPP